MPLFFVVTFFTISFMFMIHKEFVGIILHSVDSCPTMDNSMSIIINIESYWYQQKISHVLNMYRGAPGTLYTFSRGKVARAMRLITHLHLVLKLRMNGAILTLPLYEVHRDSCALHCCLLLKCL
jgi:hypothetical protein